jgi:hypothetical protein
MKRRQDSQTEEKDETAPKIINKKYPKDAHFVFD